MKGRPVTILSVHTSQEDVTEVEIEFEDEGQRLQAHESDLDFPDLEPGAHVMMFTVAIHIGNLLAQQKEPDLKGALNILGLCADQPPFVDEPAFLASLGALKYSLALRQGLDPSSRSSLLEEAAHLFTMALEQDNQPTKVTQDIQVDVLDTQQCLADILYSHGNVLESLGGPDIWHKRMSLYGMLHEHQQLTPVGTSFPYSKSPMQVKLLISGPSVVGTSLTRWWAVDEQLTSWTIN